jgi:hypothetical protein
VLQAVAARLGNRAIKRSATAVWSAGVNGCPGDAVIIEINFRIAISRGSRLKSAASSQGSTFWRASTERTVSSAPFLSSPTDAYRKLLYVDEKVVDGGAERTMFDPNYHRPNPIGDSSRSRCANPS